MAVILTAPFASAFFVAYPEDAPPGWIESLRPELGSLLTFSDPNTVYERYGRVYNLVYLLVLPAVVGWHRLHGETRA